MRDIVFLIFTAVMIILALRRPYIAFGLCLWTALFFPNGWLYGFSSVIRYNFLFFIIAILSLFLNKNKIDCKNQFLKIGIIVFIFYFWTILTSIFHSSNPLAVSEYLSRVTKTIILFFFIVYTTKTLHHLKYYLYVVILSVGFYAMLEGLKYLASGGGHAIEGLPSHSLADRNELAVAFAMTIPIVGYMIKYPITNLTSEKYILYCFLGFLIISIIGTNSRGGFISLLFIGSLTLYNHPNRFKLSFLLIIFIPLIYTFIPANWFERMDTLENAKEDASFMGRVVAWKLSYIMALDHPIMGGGFKAIEYLPNWAYYSNFFENHPYFYTGDHVPEPIARAAHSIYFQVLGDHGFIGLLIYLILIFNIFSTNSNNKKMLNRENRVNLEEKNISSAITISLTAFLLGGAALSFAYFDLFYALIALLISLNNIIKREVDNNDK